MMDTFCVNIPTLNSDIDQDILERSVRIWVDGPKVYRSDIYNAVSEILGIDRIEALDKRGNMREWYVTVNNSSDFNILVEAGFFETQSNNFWFTSCSKRRVVFKVHWAPRWYCVSNNGALLKRAFSRYGKVLNITEDICQESGGIGKNGVFSVEMEMSEENIHAVPHFFTLCNGAHKLLITSRDRAPLCLRCLNLGHKSFSCPRRQEYIEKVSYSQVVTGNFKQATENQPEVEVLTDVGSDNEMEDGMLERELELQEPQDDDFQTVQHRKRAKISNVGSGGEKNVKKIKARLGSSVSLKFQELTSLVASPPNLPSDIVLADTATAVSGQLNPDVPPNIN